MALRLKEVPLSGGTKLYAVGSINGVRVNRSTGYSPLQKKLAKMRLREIELELLGADKPAKRASGPTIGQGLSLYLNRPGGVGVTTETYVQRFVAKHRDMAIESVMPMDVTKFVWSPKKSASTIRREVNAIQGFLNFVREGIMLPPLRIRKPDEHAPKSTRFSQEQRDKMLAVCEVEEPWFVPHLTFLFYTGARRSELCKLKWADVQMSVTGEPINIVLRSRKGVKGKLKERVVPVHPALVPCLKALRMLRRPRPEHSVFLSCTGQPINTPAGINKAFDRVAEAAGLGELTPHDARRTFASDLLENDVAELVITDMLGHIDRRMLKVYAVVSDDMRRKSVEKISSPTGG